MSDQPTTPAGLSDDDRDELRELAALLEYVAEYHAHPSFDFGDDWRLAAHVWTRLDEARARLSVVARSVSTYAAPGLAESGYVRKDGYLLDDGAVVHHTRPTRDEWHGQKVLRALSAEMVDAGSGEVVHAVPLSVLVQVIPGCRTDEQTSSRWLLGGLRATLGDGNKEWEPDGFRWREYGKPQLAKGPGR